MVSRWAHNSKVGGSKPLSAIFFHLLSFPPHNQLTMHFCINNIVYDILTPFRCVLPPVLFVIILGVFRCFITLRVNSLNEFYSCKSLLIHSRFLFIHARTHKSLETATLQEKICFCASTYSINIVDL